MGIIEYFILGVLTVLVAVVIFFIFDRRLLLKKYRDISEENRNNKDTLQENIEFAESIGKGEFKRVFSLPEDNILGTALIKMRENIIKASIEDEHRNWVSEGLAKFSNLLRSDQDVFEMTDTLISEIVKYMGANQGRMFLA